MTGSKALAVDAFGAERGPRGHALRLFRPRPLGRRLQRRHDHPLARGGARRLRADPRRRRSSSAPRWAAGSRCCSTAPSGCSDGLGRVKALILIAPAVDMTEDLMLGGFTRKEHEGLQGAGLRRAALGLRTEPYRINRALIEDGRNHLLFGKAIDAGVPGDHHPGRQGPRRAQGARAQADGAPHHRPGDLHADPRRRAPAEPRGGFAVLEKAIERAVESR